MGWYLGLLDITILEFEIPTNYWPDFCINDESISQPSESITNVTSSCTVSIYHASFQSFLSPCRPLQSVLLCRSCSCSYQHHPYHSMHVGVGFSQKSQAPQLLLSPLKGMERPEAMDQIAVQRPVVCLYFESIIHNFYYRDSSCHTNSRDLTTTHF